jgi:hypothetical protein
VVVSRITPHRAAFVLRVVQTMRSLLWWLAIITLSSLVSGLISMSSFQQRRLTIASTTMTTTMTKRKSSRLYNIYDDWKADLLSSSQSRYTYDDLILPLDEDTIVQCLNEFIDSDYGKTMFGKHDAPADRLSFT